MTAPGTLLDSLARHVHELPTALAVTVGSVELTYEDLDRRSSVIAAALVADGVGPDHRVAFLGRESADYYATLFAVAKLGAVLVPVNPRLSTAEVAHIVADSGATVVFADPDLPVDADPDVLVVPTDRSMPEPERSLDAPWFRPEPDTPVVQLYTSGTTGLPKGVVLAHRSFFAVLRSLREAGLDWIEVDADDVCLVGIPGFHVGGIWFAAQAFNAGATVVGMPSFDAATARRLIVERAVTKGIWVPAMLAALLAVGPSTPDDFATVDLTIYGGAPISDALLERCIQGIGGRFAQIYGLTETGNTAICLPPDDHVVGSPRLRAAGRPYPCVEARIVGDDGEDLPPGEIGEVWLRSPAAMVEYWHRPDATATTLVDGWIRTGDAGELDDDGYLWLKDRLNDMIIVGGENVYPAEVENVIARHPAVADVAVIGIPDPAAGEAVVAYIRTLPGADVTTRELLLHARGQLADFKLPRRYEFVDDIPRNPSGKILRRQLREPHWQGLDRRIN